MSEIQKGRRYLVRPKQNLPVRAMHELAKRWEEMKPHEMLVVPDTFEVIELAEGDVVELSTWPTHCAGCDGTDLA